MTRHRRSAMIALLIISTAATAAFGEDYFIYSPQQVTKPQEGVLVVGKDELLVREIVIEKGDTLTKLSRKFSGRGSYFPQILLFNEINNPDLIYAGNTLKVPVGKTRAGAVQPVTPEQKKQMTATEPVEQSQLEKKSGSKKMKNGRKRPGSKKSAEKEKKKLLQPEATPSIKPLLDTGTKPAVPVSPTNADQSQKIIFDQAITAYKQNDCTKAMDLFDRFLAKNATSPLAAEASLLKAECLLKLSGSP